MGTNLSSRLEDRKWLEIRRKAHNMVEIKICPDAVLDPVESFCHITEEEFIEIILKGVGNKFKRIE